LATNAFIAHIFFLPVCKQETPPWGGMTNPAPDNGLTAKLQAAVGALK